MSGSNEESNEKANENGKQQSEAKQSPAKQDPPPTILSWSVRAGSLIAIVALLGYIVVTGLSTSTPPTIEATLSDEPVEMRSGQWVLKATVKNTGDVSVNSVVVKAELVGTDDTVVESEDSTIALLGQGSSTDVDFWFSVDPEQHDIQLSAGSYVLP